MDKFLTKLNSSQPSSSVRGDSSQPSSGIGGNFSYLIDVFDLTSLKNDPEERISIYKYSSRIRVQVRRHYIHKGPCRSVRDYHFPKTLFGKKMHQFSVNWFEGCYSRWLEYSEKRDAAFYLCCYLFKDDHVHGSMGDFFTKIGFKARYKGSQRLSLHVGEVNDIHNRCFSKMQDLSNQSQPIQVAFKKQPERKSIEHRISLNSSIDVVRFLLDHVLSF
ncbi:uncharacterized protein LOC132639314 [Lycium barbarum]|uniref:uncharacterized protein LOC132639314 n=1 Tax=Lycium barbarum TaxID=112863 RepID=UPI00293EE8F5|nr:uncharacterized protein LOC132639314 [Lycium barbarum]